MYTFRTALAKDACIITKLVNSAYRGEYSKKGWTTEADLIHGQRTDEDSIREMILTKGEQIELAFNLEGDLLGCVYLKFEAEDTLYFGMLTVEPSHQGTGLGKQILTHLETIARNHHVKKIRLTVIPQRRELIAFYERRGFVATGRVEDFPHYDPRHGTPLVKDLKLIEYLKILT